jgi:hypothetical protein
MRHVKKAGLEASDEPLPVWRERSPPWRPVAVPLVIKPRGESSLFT